MVGEVVQGAGGAARRLHVAGVLHGAHDGRHHLRGAHDGVPGSFLLRKLVDHDCSLIHHHLRYAGIKKC